MEKYKILEVIGKGSFGEVVKARNIETGDIVAIKKMKQKFATWEECMNLRELKSLRKLQHKNIVKLHEVLRVQSELSFVFEHVEQDIYKFYDSHKSRGTTLPEPTVRSIFFQLAQSLAFMHKHGYFHRDLKPENIMYGGATDGMLKLIDFGLAREIRSRPPYTEYVATRWYRAPELLLQSTNYNSPVDIFALGCIMAELYIFRPLFNGASEQDQLQKLCSVLGTPSKTDWPEGYRLAGQRGISFPSYPAIPLSQVITGCPAEAVSLIAECLRWDPQKRPTASKILQHSFFRDVESVLPKNYFSDEDQSKKLPQTSAPPAATSSLESQSQQQQQHQSRPSQLLNSENEVNRTTPFSLIKPSAAVKASSDLDKGAMDYLTSNSALSNRQPFNLKGSHNNEPIALTYSERTRQNHQQQQSGFNYNDFYENLTAARMPTGRKSSSKYRASSLQQQHSNNMKLESTTPAAANASTSTAAAGEATSSPTKHAANSESTWSSSNNNNNNMYNFSNLNAYQVRGISQNPRTVPSRSQLRSRATAAASVTDNSNLSVKAILDSSQQQNNNTTTSHVPAAAPGLSNQPEDDILNNLLSSSFRQAVNPSKQLPSTTYGEITPQIQNHSSSYPQNNLNVYNNTNATSNTSADKRQKPIYEASSNNNNNNNSYHHSSNNYAFSNDFSVVGSKPNQPVGMQRGGHQQYSLHQPSSLYGNGGNAGGVFGTSSNSNYQVTGLANGNNINPPTSSVQNGGGFNRNGISSNSNYPAVIINSSPTKQLQQYGNKYTSNNSTAAAASNNSPSLNKNIYDFNHIRQPVRPVGLLSKF